MKQTTLPSKTRLGRACLVPLGALWLLSSPLGAQSSPTNSPNSTSTEDTIELSPFEVNSAKDQGYYSPSTLAGTRINTDLKDLSAPVTVVTKEFMEDIGATNVNDILAYEVGSEGTRDFTSTQGQLGRTTDGPSADPTASIRGRGLSTYDITRGYFFSLTASNFSSLSSGTSVGFDPYNLDSVTISRGPNSILAGLGSPSGIIDYTPQTALLDRNKYEVTARWGSYGDKRATVNANIVMAKDVAALRFASEASDEGFRQQPAYNRDNRYYLAGTYKPFSNTTIHASYEVVRVHHDLPNSLTPEDDISQWVALGKPSASNGVASSSLLFAGQGGGEPSVLFNKDGSVSGAYNTALQRGFVQANLGDVGIWQATRFGSDQYGDWEDINTSASNALNRLNAFNVSVDQQILPGLVLNVAYVQEELKSNQINLFRPDYVSYEVDVNQTIPTGAANPHYGETFMYFRGLDNSQNTRATNGVGRATLTYDLDLKKYNKWAGKYNLTAFAEARRTESNFLDYNTEASVGGSLVETGRLYYLGGNAGNGYTIQSVPHVPSLASGQTYTNADGTTATLDESYVLKENDKNITKLHTTAIVAQGYLLDDRVVPLVGIRHDNDRAAFGVSTAGPATYNPYSDVAATTKSYGVVVHPFKWLNLFYNHSQNFIPNAGSVDLLGNPVSNPTGVSKDWGASVDLLGGKLNAKVDWYEITAASSPDATVNFPLVQWTLPFVELGYNGSVGPYQDLANQAGVAYKPGPAAGLSTGDNRLANAYTADMKARGVELELTYNITNNWRLFATLSQEKAEQTNIAKSLTDYINSRVAYWKSVPGLWTGQTTTHDWSGAPETGEQVFNTDILPAMIAYQSAEGQQPTQLHKWKGSLVTNYTFDAGYLRNFNVGTGLRYLDKTVIGYPAIYSNVNGVSTVTALDVAHPYTTPSRVGVDAWIGYSMKLARKYQLSFQLRVQDFEEDGSYRPIVANSDGTHSVYTIVMPRSYFLTSKLDF
jgi:outer membrane receptor protein involved in Fe transport